MNNTALHVAVTGQGPNLVLLHGWGLHSGIWKTLLPLLESHFTVHNIDVPGFGRSKPLSITSAEYYRLDYLVDTIGEVMPERSYLMGWSLGGVIATAIARQFESKVEKLVTVASSPRFVANEEWPYAMKQEVLESFIGYLSKDFKGTLNRFLSIQTMGSPTQKQDLAELKETVFKHGLPDEKALEGGLNILNEVDLLDQLAKLSMPLLRVYGKLDTLVPAKSIKQIAEYAPNSESLIFNKSGHAPFLSQTNEFADKVIRFLTKR
ncbi:MAG: pimeloyl-ACP methyl ester esterase BioH [Kangiellaceae bacterium]|nr:pimeloyl-ACP methyl ester esterase BioH [Kangiellaceae bacterium]